MSTQQPTTQYTGPNSKRPSKMASTQSLNHLLNFSLPPRQVHQYSSPIRRKKQGQNQAVWNKERFVNAQYRFVMNPLGDYTVHFADPDIYFPWNDILQVIVPREAAVSSAAGTGGQSADEEGVTTCPICLSPPNAPRMTRCGHVFCLPCILHYLSTSDTLKWVRCPICFDSIHKHQLKAVKWIDPSTIIEEEEDTSPPRASTSSASFEPAISTTPLAGTMLRMRLIQRPQITTLALPRSKTWPSDLLPPHQTPFHFLPDVYLFSKFMLATPSAIISDLTQDLDDLDAERRVLSGMHDDLGVSFIDAADAQIRQQRLKTAAMETPQLTNAIDAAHHALEQIQQRAAFHSRKVQDLAHALTDMSLEDTPTEFLAQQSSALQVTTPTSVPPDTQRVSTPTRNPRQRRNLNPPPPSTSTYYYYQAASGMPIFLHPLDIKILLSHFGSYEAFPDTITVRVESHKESTVNDDLRKRCKYLSHLPAGADVVFVETDLGNVVGQDGLKNFERALTMRRSRRLEKDRKDDKARAKAEEREKEKVVHNWNEMTRHRVDAYIPPPAPRTASPFDVDDSHEFPEPGQERVVAPPVPVNQRPQQSSGVWGARSFASAAQHASSGTGRAVPAQQRSARQAVADEADEWELDAAFHELEQQRANRSGGGGGGGGGGGKKKKNRLVVLGGGGGRRR
ncbi:hypothetical protein BDY19DRAFT_879789 [Irpex rosettiformis]|uniref:Uncharacterized protein n=1 Tax=Irpex rosettiformis TaxID=378272 RepID=A0ACB8UIU0_9APHY|nr:hypothetical protein BDY19DRAFT_879789 [Irpex rosettiformis]